MNSQIKKQIVKNLVAFFSAITFFTAAFQAPCKTWTFYEGNDKEALRDAIDDNDIDKFSDLINETNPNELKKLAYCFATAIERSRINICRLILEINENIINTEYYGQTPLSYAARWNLTNVINFLLHHGADVNGKSRQGNTALHQAAHQRHYGACTLLIKNGADVNARNNNGETPMHLAALQNANPSICKLLTMCGANFNATDNNGNKPIDLAWDDFKQSLISNQPCSQDGCRQYIRDNNISTCPVCMENTSPDEFMCIYNCYFDQDQNRPCYEHAICQTCLKESYLVNIAEDKPNVCPFCKSVIASHDAQR